MLPEEWKEMCNKKMHKEGKYDYIRPSMDAQTCLDVLTDHLLGDDWYINDPMGPEQANAIIVLEILEKYPESRRKRLKRWLQKLIDKL